MRFRDLEQPEPDDGLEARLTADAEAWLGETSRSFTDTPAALLPGVSRAEVTPEEEPAVAPVESPDDAENEPTVIAPTRGKWARRAPLLVAAAVIALVAAVAIPLVADRPPTAEPGPSSPAPAVPVAAPRCPQVDGDRPADQGSTTPAAGSLVPSEVPIAMLICEYPLPIEPEGPPEIGKPIDYAYQALKSSRTIRSGLSSVPNDLSRFPASQEGGCMTSRMVGRPAPEGSDFQVALQYPSGVIWITDSTGPTVCSIAMGSGGTSPSYSDLFLRSLRSGSWAASERQSVRCPESLDASPFVGKLAMPKPSSDTDDRLVALEPPVAVVLCGYSSEQNDYEFAGFDSPFSHLERALELRGDFSALVAALRETGAQDIAHMKCPMTDPDRGTQLIGLTYGIGPSRATVWVESGQGVTCGGSTNGVVSTLGRISAASTDALNGKLWPGLEAVDLDPYGVGVPMPSVPYPTPLVTETSMPEWTEDPPASTSVADQACLDFSGGPRLSETMIPAGYSSVAACFYGPVDLPAGLVDEINALSDPVDASKCFNGDTYQDSDETPSMVFLYPNRSPVVIYFYDNCAPLIGNGDHEVAAPKAMVAQLRKMAGY